MPDLENLKAAKNYHVDIPFANKESFYVKGSNNLDWGMKKHLANIFSPKSGNTVMFAFDHGYFMGSVSGLEAGFTDSAAGSSCGCPYVHQRSASHLCASHW